MLRHLAEVMDARPDLEVHVWFLRCAWNEQAWQGSFVVDSLRTWWPAALLQGIGFTRMAGRVRGARLRMAMRRVDPDLVVLDDALGGRLLGHLGPRCPIVIRQNEEPPADAMLESQFEGDATGLMCAPAAEGDAFPGATVIPEYETRDDWEAARSAGSDEVRSRVRQVLGLPTDEPLVTGWGDSGWIDGPDVFIRTLWSLENRHGVLAHGAWFGSFQDRHERERLLAEARRCGVAHRFHHFEYRDLPSWTCGDAVLLPWRDAGDREQVLNAICAGSAVVTFPVGAIDDPAVRVVEHLDVDAAARALADALDEDRSERWRDTLRRLDTQSLIDDLKELALRGRVA